MGQNLANIGQDYIFLYLLASISENKTELINQNNTIQGHEHLALFVKL